MCTRSSLFMGEPLPIVVADALIHSIEQTSDVCENTAAAGFVIAAAAATTGQLELIPVGIALVQQPSIGLA